MSTKRGGSPSASGGRRRKRRDRRKSPSRNGHDDKLIICPFVARAKFNGHPSPEDCCGTSTSEVYFRDISKLNEHLKRCHSLAYVCVDCMAHRYTICNKKMLKTLIDEHKKECGREEEEECGGSSSEDHRINPDGREMMTPEQHIAYSDKWRNQDVQVVPGEPKFEVNWRKIYQALFPDVQIFPSMWRCDESSPVDGQRREEPVLPGEVTPGDMQAVHSYGSGAEFGRGLSNDWDQGTEELDTYTYTGHVEMGTSVEAIMQEWQNLQNVQNPPPWVLVDVNHQQGGAPTAYTEDGRSIVSLPSSTQASWSLPQENRRHPFSTPSGTTESIAFSEAPSGAGVMFNSQATLRAPPQGHLPQGHYLASSFISRSGDSAGCNDIANLNDLETPMLPSNAVRETDSGNDVNMTLAGVGKGLEENLTSHPRML